MAAVDAKTEQALSALTNLKVERRVVIDLKEGANFKFDSANLPPKAKKEIDAMLNEMQSESSGLGGTTFVVAGHTDNTGGPGYNYDLGQKRANAVARYLAARKTVEPGTRVIPVSYGETNPLSANNTAEGRAKNRRVEILVYRDAVATDAAAESAQAKPTKPEQTAQQQHR
jgi:outer membrane protein OmpA-like peptidoglycan-associated protein